MTTDSEGKNWDSQLAEAILSLGESKFWPMLEGALKGLVNFDFVVIFGYRGDEVPVNLYNSFDPRRLDIHVIKYLDGPYLLDPFFQACRANNAPGLYRLKEIAPDRFYQSEYYRSYYKETDLAEEIGFLFRLPEDTYIVLSLMRVRSSSVFSGKEMKQLRSVEKTVRALTSQHWQYSEAMFSDSGTGFDQTIVQKRVNEVFKTFGTSILTSRECEVVGLVLRGYSSEAIADILGIAKGTVKTYRRSIYAKLGISSQSELFSMFISALQISPLSATGNSG